MRCGGSLCTQHAPVAGRRCFACEWLGYHLRWMWREVALSTAAVACVGLAWALVLERTWVAYAFGVAVLWLVARWRPLAWLDGYKRRVFLAERRPGLWYEHAIALRRGKVKPNAQP